MPTTLLTIGRFHRSWSPNMRRWNVAVVAMTAVVMMLTGCAQQLPGQQQPAQPEDLMAGVQSALADTHEIVGGDWNPGAPFQSSCVTADNLDGAQIGTGYDRIFIANEIATESDIQAVNGKVESLWVGLGYEVTQPDEPYGPHTYSVVAQNANNGSLRLDIRMNEDGTLWVSTNGKTDCIVITTPEPTHFGQ